MNPSSTPVGILKLLIATLMFAISLSAQTWNGAGSNDNFSTSANWSGGSAPTNDGTAIATFSGSVRTSPVLDLDYTLDTLNIASSNFTLNGSNSLTLNSGLLKTNPSYTVFTANVPIILGNDLSFGGTGAQGSITLSGGISGAHGISTSGANNHAIYLDGTNTFTGDIQVNSGRVFVGNSNASTTASIASGIDVVLGDNTTFGFNRTGAATFDGIISGTGEIFSTSGSVSTAAFDLTLTNQSTFTGGTNIGFGKLIIGTTDALPTTTALYISSFGTLDVQNNQTVGSMSGGTGSLIDVTTGKTFTSNLSSNSTTGGTAGAGAVVVTGSFDLQTYDEWEHTGGTTVTDANLIIGAGYSYGGLVGNVTNNGTVTFNQSVPYTYEGAMTGNGGIDKKGTNMLTLAGENNLSGTSTIEAGILRIGSGAVGSLTSNLTINSGATVQFPRYNDQSYSGLLAGSGSLEKTVSGTLTLDGSGSFDGTISTAAYTKIRLDGTYASANAQVNGTLYGSGTLSNVNVANAGIITAGSMLATGTLTLNDLTLAGGSKLTVEMLNATGTAGSASGWDLLGMSGTLDLSGASTGSPITVLLDSLSGVGTTGAALNFSDNSHYSWDLISGASSVVGFSADKFAINTSSFDNAFTGAFSVSQVGNDIRLNFTSASAVPEPASYATLLALTVLGLAAQRRRTRRPAGIDSPHLLHIR